MPALAPLRWVALAAGVVLIFLAAVVAYDPTGLFWAILFVVVNLVRIVLDRRGQTRPFSPEERLFHERIVPSLSPRQTLKLLSVGRWHDVAAGTALTREGESTAELSFISRGEVDIMVGGRKVAECGPGALIGEGGLGDRGRGHRNRSLRNARPLSRLRRGAALRPSRPPYRSAGRGRTRGHAQPPGQAAPLKSWSRQARRSGILRAY